MVDDRLRTTGGTARSAAEIEEQIRETRAALAKTVTALGQELKVQITDTVDRVADKIETGVDQVRGSLEHGVHSVTASLDTAITSVRTTVDIPARVQRAPFTMVAVAAGLGFLLTQRGGSRRREAPVRALLPLAKEGILPLTVVALLDRVLRPVLVAAVEGFVVTSLRHRFAGAPTGSGGPPR